MLCLIFLGQEAEGFLGRLVVVRRRGSDPPPALHPDHQVPVPGMQPEGVRARQQEE